MSEAANLNEVPSIYLIKTSLNLGDYANVTSNQAPDTELARGGDLGGLTPAEARIASHMLRFSADPLPAPLWRLETTQERQAAIALFDKLRDWCDLSNSEMDRDRRSSLEEETLLLIQGSRELRCELYLQLVKQTRGNLLIKDECTAWSLFATISTEISCPDVLFEIIRGYVELVGSNSREFVLIRKFALDILRNVAVGLQGSAMVETTLGIHKWEAAIVTGSLVDIYYEQLSSVSEVLAQIAWAIGLQRTLSFQLYILKEDGSISMLDRRSSIGFTRSTKPGNLVMKKESFRLGEQSLYLDPVYRQLAFTQCRVQYLQGDLPVEDGYVSKNATLLILADGRPNLLQDLASLAQIVFQFLPTKNISQKTGEEWATSILRSAEQIDANITQVQAQLDFLSSVDDMPCGNCSFFSVKRVVSAPWDNNEEEIKIGASRHGVYFIRGHPPGVFYSVSIAEIVDIKFHNGSFTLETTGEATISLELEFEQGAVLTKITNTHKADYVEHVADHAGSPTRNMPEIATDTTGDNSSVESSAEVNQGGAGSAMHQTPNEAGAVPQSNSRNANEIASSNSQQDLSTEGAASPNLRRTLLCGFKKTSRRARPRESVRVTRFISSVVTRRSPRNQLKIGRAFLKRYKLINNESDMRYKGIDMTSSEKVHVIFHSDHPTFENTNALNSRLADCRHVSTVIDSSIQTDKHMPFHVIKRGEPTLVSWLGFNNLYLQERESVLHQLINLTAEIHSKDLLISNFDPEKIEFFPSDFTWKLVDVSCLSEPGQPITSTPKPELSAPETLSFDEGASPETTGSMAMDMYALGVLAFHILTGSPLFGENPSSDYIRSYLESGLLPQLESIRNRNYRELLSGLLAINPVERLSAQDALAKVSEGDSVRSHTQRRTIPQELPHEAITEPAMTGELELTPGTVKAQISVEPLASGSEGSATGENETRTQVSSVSVGSIGEILESPNELSLDARSTYRVVVKLSWIPPLSLDISYLRLKVESDTVQLEHLGTDLEESGCRASFVLNPSAFDSILLRRSEISSENSGNLSSASLLMGIVSGRTNETNEVAPFKIRFSFFKDTRFAKQSISFDFIQPQYLDYTLDECLFD